MCGQQDVLNRGPDGVCGQQDVLNRGPDGMVLFYLDDVGEVGLGPGDDDDDHGGPQRLGGDALGVLPGALDSGSPRGSEAAESVAAQHDEAPRLRDVMSGSASFSIVAVSGARSETLGTERRVMIAS